jgi:ribonuclease HII
MDWTLEQRYWKKGFEVVVGADEAGRGALAGPLFVAVAGFEGPTDIFWDDSKKYSSHRKRKHIAYRLIQLPNFFWAVGWADPNYIDQNGISAALGYALKMALDKLGIDVSIVLVDGPYPFRGVAVPQRPVVRGDRQVPSIAAASVIAKVFRDSLMISLPDNKYGFALHKGYGTKAHRESIKQWGISPWHRRSFCGGALGNEKLD